MQNLLNKPLENGVDVIACPHPLKVRNFKYKMPEGLTVSEVLCRVQPDARLRKYAHISLNGKLLPRELWSNTIVNDGDALAIRVVPMGGGGGDKDIFTTVLAIAIIAVSVYYGDMSGVMTGVSMLAQNALAEGPQSSTRLLSGGGSNALESPSLFVDGARNDARHFQPIPVVLGNHKQIGPLGANVFTEMLGKSQYIYMVIIWGYGPLKIENLRIAETDINDFDGVSVQSREGRDTDLPLSIFSNQVDSESLHILISQASGWHSRTTNANTDEITVDVSFFKGLTRFNDEGRRRYTAIELQIRYRRVGDASFIYPTFSRVQAASLTTNGSSVILQQATSTVHRPAFSWTVATRDKYEVQIRRLTGDTLDTQKFNEVHWVALKSIMKEDPINFPLPLAKTALRIRATGQLNRIIDNLSAELTSYALDWNGATWAEALTSNPASLFRLVLQGAAMANPLPDSRLDLDNLQDWHEYCVANGFEFDMVRDFQSSVWGTLVDIASAGRATPLEIDGKWGVVFDELQTIPVQHFTSRNSWGFSAEKTFVEMPHAFRTRFANRDMDWRIDEIIIYDDDYDESNATVFEELDEVGITSADHAWKYGRFNLAQLRLRPEGWTLNVDFEYLICRRGNLVLVTHDVLLVGLASGRITALQLDGGGDATGMTVDEVLTMEASKSYGVSIRTVDDAALVRTIVLDIGDQTTIVFDSVIPAANLPVVGDLFSFGEAGSETIEGLVRSIEPESDLVAKLNIIPNSPAIYTADTGTIPSFETKITNPNTLPQINIINVRADESALALGGNDTLIIRIAAEVVPISDSFNATIETEIKLVDSTDDFGAADIDSITKNFVFIKNVEHLQTYNLRLRWANPDYLLQGVWTEWNNVLVIGQTNPPSALENFTLSAFGGSALIRWDKPTELDVLFGGTVVFRHSHELTESSASWEQSVSIGQQTKGTDLLAVLPLKPGTYMAKVKDRGGRFSDVVKMSTKQASVLTYTNVHTMIEEAAFSGTHTNTVATGGILKLAPHTYLDDWADVDAIADWDSEGGLNSEGTYDFAANLDLSTVQQVRLTTDIEVVVTNTLDLIDDRTELMDVWDDLDGLDSAAGDARVQERHTDDDPAGTPTWTEWNYLESAEFTARAFDFRLLMSTLDPAFNILVSKLQVKVEDV